MSLMLKTIFVINGPITSGNGSITNEKGIEKRSGKVRVVIDPFYYRPTEVEELLGDARKAKEKLDWEPNIKFEELVRIMTKADWEKVKRRGY